MLWKIIKVILIVIATLIILISGILAYIIIKNPLGLGELTKAYIKTVVLKQDSALDVEDYNDFDHPLLNASQESAAISAGIDIKKIPKEITLTQQQCGISKLGQTRINEIASGSAPTALELVKLLPCADLK